MRLLTRLSVAGLLVLACAVRAQPAPAANAPEPHPFDAAQEALGTTVYEALKANKVDQKALDDARRLVKLAPDNPRAHRLLGIALSMGPREQWLESEAVFRRALELKVGPAERRGDVFATLAEVRLRLGKLTDAGLDVKSALQADPRSLRALVVGGIVSARQGEKQEAVSRFGRAVELAPAVGNLRFMHAAALFDDGRFDEARSEVRRARELGYSAPDLDAIEKELAFKGRLALGLQLMLWSAIALVVALFVLWAFGAVLSRAQVAKLAAVQSHLSGDEQTPGERAVLGLYKGLLWFGISSFYVSVPALIGLTLGIGGVLLYLLFTEVRTIPIKLVLILAAAAVGGAWAIVRSLFLGKAPEETGLEVREDKEPKLFAALHEVAEVARAPKVDRVYLEQGAGIAVREAGGALAVLAGRGERILHLGFAAVRALNVAQLKAVLAHEAGHFSHGDTRLSPVLARMQTTLVQTLARMNEIGWSTYVNPVYWYLQLYVRVFFAVTAGEGRRRELLADRAAALAYGGDTFGTALQAVIEADDRWSRGAVVPAIVLRQSGRPVDDAYALADAVAGVESATLRQQRLREHLDRPMDRYDSHPPPADRIARVHEVSASRPLDTSPASTLFADADAVARQLTGQLRAQVADFLASRGAPVGEEKPFEPALQLQLAAGLSLHREACELLEKGDAQAAPTLEQAIDRIKGAVGAVDPLLVEPLIDMGRAQKKAGRSDAAEEAARAALEIVKSKQMSADYLPAIQELLPEGTDVAPAPAPTATQV